MAFEELKYLLTEEGVPVTFTADGKRFRAEPSFKFIQKEDGFDFNMDGYDVYANGKLEELKNFEEFEKKFSGCKLVISEIADRYESIEEYEKKKAFDRITMDELLELVLPYADSFSLTCPYNGYDGKYDKNHPHGVYKISEELAEVALKDIAQHMKLMAQRQLEGIYGKPGNKLPPFDKLYAEIEEEYCAYRKMNEEKAETHGGFVCFCDEFSYGRTKYKEPQELWHLYNSVDFVGACAYSLGQMKQNVLERPLDCELDEDGYKELKSSYIKTDVTFNWHCTTSGQLSKVHYFKLTKDAVSWLRKHKSDYEFGELCDLAFYGKGEVLFSSCTHEGFHTISEKITER